ncbi:MAG: Gfo/Idh/MocA family oxidoreductase [Gaiellaceae bacterium]|jgi:predicted dehydrogenase
MTDRVDGKVLRVAVVGLGYWGPNLVRVLHEIPGVDVVYACDLDPERLERIGARYPSVKLTIDYDQILADSSVDAVLIVTKVHTHHLLAKAALEAGKHVFVEKPMAASSAQALELIELAEDRGLTLMPGHTFLYSPPVNKCRELIQSGELGEIYFISMSRVNLGLHQSDVSVIWDLGPHDFSILRYWLEEAPSRVSATCRCCIIEGISDVAFIDLEFPSGTIAHIELSWLAPSKLRRTAIVGSKKMVVYDDTSNESVRVFDSGVDVPNPETFGEYRMTYRVGDIVSPNIGVAEPLYLELADFCTAVRSGSKPRSSARFGLDVIRVTEAVETSIRTDTAAVSTRQVPA